MKTDDKNTLPRSNVPPRELRRPVATNASGLHANMDHEIEQLTTDIEIPHISELQEKMKEGNGSIPHALAHAICTLTDKTSRNDMEIIMCIVWNDTLNTDAFNAIVQN